MLPMLTHTTRSEIYKDTVPEARRLQMLQVLHWQRPLQRIRRAQPEKTYIMYTLPRDKNDRPNVK